MGDGQRLAISGWILEREGRLEEAMKLWRDAFKEGSHDPETIQRLSMHLERAKEYGAAAEVIREALARRLPRMLRKPCGNGSHGARKRPSPPSRSRASALTFRPTLFARTRISSSRSSKFD